MLIYRGAERLHIDGIWCIPGDDFLRQLHPGRRLTPMVSPGN
jgi:hypothetical protein